ncbi:MAG: hypothetical protein DCC71_13615 [Proteobacteria bacterium]|nr:MAG: hypothetical protein DCC71_13615 [Pseudomonadota bacterium]
MPRATPNSRPFGFASQRPPAAATESCAAQQLPKLGTPASYTARANAICRSTRASPAAWIVRLEPVHAMPS